MPHYPTKVTTGMSIIPGWNRPNANGINANINDKDYNGPDFKPRPLKQWRRQLRVYDFKGVLIIQEPPPFLILIAPEQLYTILNPTAHVLLEKAEIHILFPTTNSVMKPKTTIIQKRKVI